MKFEKSESGSTSGLVQNNVDLPDVQKPDSYKIYKAPNPKDDGRKTHTAADMGSWALPGLPLSYEQNRGSGQHLLLGRSRRCENPRHEGACAFCVLSVDELPSDARGSGTLVAFRPGHPLRKDG
ncbi:hypothetical protein J6590_053347 [Homalodisca vitripennis]|nr:hypothetical protein J6590_091312 [Homalodisca vitripennis]KAG8330897.1 hypothetical protein J6590_053347 [Homalodisca vitripennis]